MWRLTYLANPVVADFMHQARIPWACYYTLDSDMGNGKLPPSMVHLLQTIDLPIAVSRYCEQVTKANNITPAYIPNGVSTKVFRPPRSKAAAKRALGYENKFVILSDARNQPRKLLPRLLDIFKRFAGGKNDV